MSVDHDETFAPRDFISKTIKLQSGSATKKEEFPKIPVRTGYHTNDIVEALVVIKSVFKVEGRKAQHLLAYIANKIFNQNWTVPPEDKTCKGSETSDEVPGKKRKSAPGYLDNVVPSRRKIASSVDDFALLSFADMAESISEAAKSGQVVTYGTDDTVKAAGKKKFDMKTTHVTIIDKEHNHQTFTSGFYENASHSGEISADTIRHDLAKMAVLTGNTYNDMLNFVNFFMTDRAGDATTMLDSLGVIEEKQLKCNAHIILCVDVAIDKVYKDAETLMGASSLISQNASHVFSSPKSSIWILVLIAFSKLLSPSHTKETISLYCDYKRFLTEDSESGSETSEISSQMLKAGFDGFQSNRFGRTGEISESVIKHQVLIRKYFDKAVDEHANRLVHTGLQHRKRIP